MIKTGRFFSYDEKTYIRKNYGVIHVREISAHTGRSVASIRQQARVLHVAGRGWINQHPPEWWNKVLVDYAAAKTRREFAAARGISDMAAMNLIRRARGKP